ncbi:MAG: cyclic nucleotide-binding domain-containing protein [Spirochaetia bacterium]|nr:cyclic nucleotide-binding domain-containing protein [Spirochaetia bacterium]
MPIDLVEKFGQKFPENTVIFREGEPGNDMFIIQSGEVIISKKSQKNTQHILAILKNGDFLGEMSLFTSENRSATAITITESIILRIDKTSFDFMLSSNLPFAKKMITKLCERLKNADDQISELVAISPDIKMLQSLNSFWKVAGQKDKSHEFLLLPYIEFIQYLKVNESINESDANHRLFKLKEKGMLLLRKDTQGKVYISFSPKVFKYFNII